MFYTAPEELRHPVPDNVSQSELVSGTAILKINNPPKQLSDQARRHQMRTPLAAYVLHSLRGAMPHLQASRRPAWSCL